MQNKTKYTQTKMDKNNIRNQVKCLNERLVLCIEVGYEPGLWLGWMELLTRWLLQMGIPERLMQLTMKCVEWVTYSILLNG